MTLKNRLLKAIGQTPEQKAEKERLREVEAGYRIEEKRQTEKAYYEARMKGAKSKARALGYAKGKGGSGGFFGTVGAVVKGIDRGLNAGAAVLGVQPERPPRRRNKHKNKKRKAHKRRSRSSSIDDIIF